jgi:hypothetical protein
MTAIARETPFDPFSRRIICNMARESAAIRALTPVAKGFPSLRL